MASRRKPLPSPKSHRAVQRDIEEKLDEVQYLKRRGRWTEACTLLEPVAARYPHHRDVQAQMAEIYHQLGQGQKYLLACERLRKHWPAEPQYALALADAYRRQGRFVLTLRTFREYLQRWPEDPGAAEVAGLVRELEAELPTIAAKLQVPPDMAEEFVALHEEINVLLLSGKIEQVRRTAERLLALNPRFAPALNNLAEACFLDGKPAEAIAAVQRVLEFDPSNLFALGNLCRYQFLSGQPEAARALVERIRALKPANADLALKKAEAFSLLGEDQAALDILGEIQPEPATVDRDSGSASRARVYHLAAVAAVRLGREADAHEYWKHALEKLPGLDDASANLADLKLPIENRNAPWPYPLAYWIRKEVLTDLLKNVGPGKGPEERQAILPYLERHPELKTLVPALLDRGDPPGRELALHVAELAETPEMLDALRDFALSRRGPDEARLRAVRIVTRFGLLPRGPIPLWVKGDLTPIRASEFEVYWEPVVQHSPEVQELIEQAVALLDQDEGTAAEAVLRRALELAPDSPVVANNLAMALNLQGRLRETEELVRRNHERHPDYFFGRVAMAQLLGHHGLVEQARAMLEPLMSVSRFHITELVALCQAQIELGLLTKNIELAQSWFNMFEKTYPDHVRVPYWRERVRKMASWQGLQKRFR